MAQLPPVGFPPHRNAKKRKRKDVFSSLWTRTSGFVSISIPNKLILRDYTQQLSRPWRYKKWRSSCTGSQSDHDIIHPGLVVVLGTQNRVGTVCCAWYKLAMGSKTRLERMTRDETSALLAEMKSCPLLRESSLCNRLTDYYLVHSQIMTDVYVERLISDACLSMIGQYKNHLKMHSRMNKLGKIADAVCAKSPVATGSCQVCMADEELLLRPTDCCGDAGAVCAKCRIELKDLCPICDRSHLNACYSCARCGDSVRFLDYGFPCVQCDKSVLCAECYDGIESCNGCNRKK